ncbi:hypothetical protein SPACI_039480 [Sporomusa acidovorans DSM 3132]|uniref:Uncharacterized protein n=1 Tax=Sporomusa acidovorans (strain ATCC 49682 / DSM 3132 / Mol) TaxID=1123286 RepID=A0ABZ3J7J3_SPOA4|nr:hypothetical protein SPACI_34000 [Sporomusa acidovorans DSM 3132]SDE37517.1 hypothetical protein SAMN04488499_101269 [Sporomusa acidovorans]
MLNENTVGAVTALVAVGRHLNCQWERRKINVGSLHETAKGRLAIDSDKV